MNKTIDGYLFEKMIKNGLANIRLKEQDINNINVFPVTDGDTGSNMRLTLESGINNSKAEPGIGSYLERLSEGMLLGAHGNSGMILSQLFKGFSKELNQCEKADVTDIKDALISAYKTAYKSVIDPVEGTILTVSREGIENISERIDEAGTIDKFLEMYIRSMKDSLDKTPELLPVLDEYSVVDSGGVGYIAIIEGMYKTLCGEDVEDFEDESLRKEESHYISSEIFNKDSSFDRCYCLEFMLQLMDSPKYDNTFDIDKFIAKLKAYGDSIVVSKDDNHRVRVHIHTFTPGEVISFSQSFGEFITFKMENMQVQYNEFVLKNPKRKSHNEHKELAIITTSFGNGMKMLFKDMGCDVVIDRKRHNVSVEKFIEEFGRLNADNIVVIPNSRKLAIVAKEAASSYVSGTRDEKSHANIEVIDANTLVEGYYALSMDIPDQGAEDRIKQMKLGAAGVICVVQKSLDKPMSYFGVDYDAGAEVAIVNSITSISGDNPINTVVKGLSLVEGIEDAENIVVFRGTNVDISKEDNLTKSIEDVFPDLEISYFDGEQDNSNWIIGIL